jgi:hypothetical protein
MEDLISLALIIKSVNNSNYLNNYISMRKLPYFFSLAIIASLFMACNDDEKPMKETPPADEGFVEINGGGTTFPNMAFVSLRTGKQTAVTRIKWDLAFSTGSDFRVLINGTTGAMAFNTESTDINAVGEAQAASLRTSGLLELTFSNLQGIRHVDGPTNALASPVIQPVSATAADNKVYILNRGSSGADVRPWKKIRVLQQNGRYILQHADLTATTFNTLEVTKDPEYNLVYVSFTEGKVQVEPKKEDWDLLWTGGTSSTPFPQALNGTLAYFFQDLVYHNIHGGVAALQILEAEIPYDNFTEAQITGLALNIENRLTIGSTWRSGGGPNASPAIRNDRYYIVKDAKGNVYKVRFVSLTKDGERGRPSFEYKLLKANS